MKKFIRIFSLALCVLMSLSGAILAADDFKPMNLKYSSPWGPDDIEWTYIDQPVWQEISKMTNNKIKLTPHFMSSLYPPDKCWDSTIMGLSDVTNGFTGFDSPGRFPISDLFAIPRMDHTAFRMMSLGYEMRNWPELQKEYKGAKLFWANSIGYLWAGSTKKPILSVADFKGMKVAAPSRWQAKVMAKLGIVPVPVPFPDLYIALQKGVIDGMLIDPNLLVKYKFGEIIKHVTKINFGAGTNYGVMNQKAWNKLPPPVQSKLEEMYNGQKFMSEIDTHLMDNHEKMMLDAQKIYNIQFYDFPKDEMQKLLKIVQPVRDEYVSFLNSKGFDGKRILEEFDQLNSKY